MTSIKNFYFSKLPTSPAHMHLKCFRSLDLRSPTLNKSPHPLQKTMEQQPQRARE